MAGPSQKLAFATIILAILVFMANVGLTSFYLSSMPYFKNAEDSGLEMCFGVFVDCVQTPNATCCGPEKVRYYCMQEWAALKCAPLDMPLSYLSGLAVLRTRQYIDFSMIIYNAFALLVSVISISFINAFGTSRPVIV